MNSSVAVAPTGRSIAIKGSVFVVEDYHNVAESDNGGTSWHTLTDTVPDPSRAPWVAVVPGRSTNPTF